MYESPDIIYYRKYGIDITMKTDTWVFQKIPQTKEKVIFRIMKTLIGTICRFCFHKLFVDSLWGLLKHTSTSKKEEGELV